MAILEPIRNQIVLFPPHAARVGWDPYNGQINRYKNYAQEVVPDEFNAYFGMGRANHKMGREKPHKHHCNGTSDKENVRKMVIGFYTR